MMEEYLGKKLRTISFKHGEHGEDENDRIITLPE
jgi:hypothetical protein